MIMTISQLIENKNAHQTAYYFNGKVKYNGYTYSNKEFDERYPINFERVILGNHRHFKGSNPDKTKIPR